MSVPTGTIAIWSGAEIDIPAGWLKCDGNNGTPDLEDRFIIGAGGVHLPHATGGSVNHNHTFTGDGHDHEIRVGGQIPAGSDLSRMTDVKQVTGTTDAEDNLPPYYALIYIMRT